MSSLMPPQRMTCSPNQSVSPAAAKVVLMTPARVAPTPCAYASAVRSACPDGFWYTATSAGTPLPSLKTSRMRWPGAFGAIITTSVSAFGLTSPKWIENACATRSVRPFPKNGAIFSNASLWCWSGTRSATTSALRAASAVSRTVNPSRSAFSHDFEPAARDRKSTRLNSSHRTISYAVFCLKKKNQGLTLPAEGLASRIEFWKKVFTQYGEDDVIIQDRIHVNIIYAVATRSDQSARIAAVQQ